MDAIRRKRKPEYLKIIDDQIEFFRTDLLFEIEDYLRYKKIMEVWIEETRKKAKIDREERFFQLWSVYMDLLKTYKKVVAFCEYSYIFHIIFS